MTPATHDRIGYVTTGEFQPGFVAVLGRVLPEGSVSPTYIFDPVEEHELAIQLLSEAFGVAKVYTAEVQTDLFARTTLVDLEAAECAAVLAA